MPQRTTTTATMATATDELIFERDSPFEGITNKTLLDANGAPEKVQIRRQGRLEVVKVARTRGELERVKELDDDAFGLHQGVTLDELEQIASAGHVLMFEGAKGKLLAEAQVLLQPIPAFPQLDDDEAYCYGTAVLKAHRGKGYAQILYNAAEVTAREAGKRRMSLTVRAENVRSIRASLHAGFRIVGYLRARYGALAAGGARLLMQKDLMDQVLPFDLDGQSQRLREGVIAVAEIATVDGLLAAQPHEIAVRLAGGDAVDGDAHEVIERILAAHYVGIGLLYGQECANDAASPTSCLIFQRADSPPAVEKPELPLQVRSEWDTLREVLVAYSPDSAQIKGETINNVAGANVGNVDSVAYRDEHETFIQALRAEGIHLVRTTVMGRDGKSGIFTRDPAFVLGETFVIGKLAREKRRYETQGMRRLAESGIAVVDMAESSATDAVVEGGDVILLADNLVAVGLGQRTNEQGLKWLRERFSPQFQFIGVRHEDLHLDVLMTVVGSRKVLADVTKLPSKFIAFLQEHGYAIIEADPREQVTLGCNVLAVSDNRVIAVAQNQLTNKRLRAAGVAVIQVDMPNVIKEGGGPRCLSCPLRRE